MEKPVLVVMAAGMGSRYGGLKQIDSIDEQGHIIIDFSIYDAIKAGFEKVIFVIKKEIEEDFKKVISRCAANIDQVEYVYQELDKVPGDYAIPEGRVKPWGTGHAILCCRDKIKGPFAIINADDFYGREAYKIIYDFLSSENESQKKQYAMVGYQLKNTLTENGSVARGVCNVDENGFLSKIVERTKIAKFADGVKYYEEEKDQWVDISQDSTVSMNLWGFQANIMEELEQQFDNFLKTEVKDNPLKSEFLIPTVVQRMIEAKKTQVKVLQSNNQWFGVTYKEDKEAVVNEVIKLKEQGIYPINLWQ